MSVLNEDRLKEIVLCILAQITDHVDMDKKTYLSWLETEVGISKDELRELSDSGFLPYPLPVEYAASEESDFEKNSEERLSEKELEKIKKDFDNGEYMPVPLDIEQELE